MAGDGRFSTMFKGMKDFQNTDDSFDNFLQNFDHDNTNHGDVFDHENYSNNGFDNDHGSHTHDKDDYDNNEKGLDKHEDQSCAGQHNDYNDSDGSNNVA